MNRSFLIAALLLVAIVGTLPLVRPLSPALTIHGDQSISVDGETRHFMVVVPDDLQQQPSLVLAFHGTGDSTESMATYSRLNTLAARHRFVLAYPAAVGPNWDTRRSLHDSTNADQLFFDHLLTRLIEQYNISEERVYAVGMSNGATFAQLLSTTRSARIAAVVAHSGMPPTDFDLAEHTTPIMLIVGENDPVSDSILTHAEKSELPCLSVPGLAHEWSPDHNDDIWNFLSRHRLAD